MTRINAAVFYTTDDNPPDVVPALIARIHADGVVDLNVFFPDESGPVPVRNVPLGRGPHSWFDPLTKDLP